VIELREFVASDGALLRAWINSPEELLLWAGPAFTWPLDTDQIAAYAKESAGATRLTWTATDLSSGSPVGHASVNLADPGVGRLGRILIDPTRRGHGLGDALMDALISHAFDELDLARIDLGVFAHNVAALRLYNRHGFTSHALIPGVERINGTSWDALQMSLTRASYYRAT